MGTEQNNKLGLIGLIAIVVSSMIGGGIFNLPSNMAEGAGLLAVVIAWVITAIGIYFLGNSFSILSDNNPDLHSGIYSYASAGFGKFIGCEIAWGYWLSAIFGNVAFAVLLMDTLGYFFPIFNEKSWAAFVGASVFIWVMYFIVRVFGVSKTTLLNNLATFAKIFVLLVILVFFAKAFSWDFASYDINGQMEHLGSLTKQVRSTMLVGLWCFIGVEGAVVLSGRAKNPKDVGKATVMGLLLCIVLFSALSILSFGTFHQAGLAKLATPSTAYLLEKIVGPWGAPFVNVGIIIALLGCWLSWTVITAEVPYIAAKDGVFPKALQKVDKNDTPTSSLLLTTVFMQLAMFVVLIDHNAWLTLVDITGLMVIPPYVASTLFLVKEVKAKKLDGLGKHKVAFAMLSGVGASIFMLWLLASSGLSLLLLAEVMFASGILVYIYSQKENKATNIFDEKDKIIAAVLVIIAIAAIVLACMGKLTLS